MEGRPATPTMKLGPAEPRRDAASREGTTSPRPTETVSPMTIRCHISPACIALGALVGSACAQQPTTPPAPPGPSGPTWQAMDQGSTAPPPVRIEPPVIDLGDVPPETKVSTEFRIFNTGSDPLMIEAVMSTCQCTAGEPDSYEILPGQSVRVGVTFAAGMYLEDPRRQVIVRLRGYSRSTGVELLANVNYGVRTHVDYDPPDQRRVGAVTLTSTTGEVFDVLSVDGRAPRFVDGFDPERDDPRPRYIVAWDLTAYEADKIPPYYIIETTHPTSPIIDMVVENLEYEPPRMPRPWMFDKHRVLLGRLEPQTSTDLVFTLAPYTGTGLEAIDDFWIEPPLAEVRLMGTQALPTGLKARVRITPLPGTRGVLAARVRFAMDGHQDECWVLGRIAPADAGNDAWTPPDQAMPGATPTGIAPMPR